MKWLLDAFDRWRDHFEEEGELHALKPVFDATERFFLSSPATTREAPHVRDPLDVKRYMALVIVALVPPLLAALYFFGLRVLAIIVVSYVAGGTVEVVFAVVRREEINEGFLVTGLIFPLVLPPALPLWMVAVGVAVGVVVGKELFGGTGRNLFNPALVGRCFLAVGYPVAMSRAWLSPGEGLTGRLLQYASAADVDAVGSATPLAEAKQGLFAAPLDLFIGRVSGSAGETSAVAILVGGIFLLAAGVANWRTVVSVLGSFALLGALLHGAAPVTFGPVGWHLLAGGLLFGAFFMATDPVTSPVTDGGKWAYGVFIGASTVLIRNLTGWVEGVMFAILLGNIFAPMLDEVVCRFRFRAYSLQSGAG